MSTPPVDHHSSQGTKKSVSLPQRPVTDGAPDQNQPDARPAKLPQTFYFPRPKAYAVKSTKTDKGSEIKPAQAPQVSPAEPKVPKRPKIKPVQSNPSKKQLQIGRPLYQGTVRHFLFVNFDFASAALGRLIVWLNELAIIGKVFDWLIDWLISGMFLFAMQSIKSSLTRAQCTFF